MSTEGTKQMSIKIKALLILLVLFFYTNVSWALWPFKYDWIKIKSENFVVLVSDEYKDYGLTVSKKAELAFLALQVVSDEHPKKTYIIVDHTKNFSNGSATFFPYPIIRIQPNTPSPFQSIGQYDDWLYELLVHEYTHILSFHNARGFYRPLRWLLGSTVSPGYFMPLWYLEGLAVNTESYLSEGGRLKSARYQSFKHELHENNISYANEQDTGRYPFGAAPYVYGSWINNYAFKNSKKYNDEIEALSALHKTFSLRVPYLINTGFKASEKVSAYESFRETFNKNRPKSTEKDLNIGRRPEWNSHHKALFYIRKDSFNRDHLYQLKDDSEKLLINFLEIAFFKVTKDFIYFSTTDIEDQDKRIFNLRSYNFKTKKIKKLSSGLNIHNFDIFNDKIIFISKNINEQRLILSKLSKLEDEKKVILRLKGEDRLSLPTFVNQNVIAYAHKKAGQKEALGEINLKSLKKRTLLRKDHINFISSFKNKIYYIYEEQGKKHLARTDLKKDLSVPQGLLSFDIKSTKEVFTSSISEKGPVIDNVSLSKLKTRTKTITFPEHKNTLKKSLKTPEVKNYNSFTKLMPHYLMPIATFSPYGLSGEFLYGISTGSQDPLGFNNYNISAFTDSVTNKLSSSFDYTSTHFRMPLSFSVSHLNTPLNLELTRQSNNASFSTAYTFNSNIGRSFTIGSGVLWSEVTDEQNNKLLRGGPFLSLSLQNAFARTRELAPRKGYKLRLSGQYFAPIETDYFDYLNLRFGARKYFKSPLVAAHRLIFGLDAQWNSERLPFLISPNSLNQLYRNSSLGDFTLRGAQTGSFFANDWFASAHVEYRFPLLNINWGPGLLPGFFNRITAAFTGDYALIGGADLINRVFIDEQTALYSAGAEIVIEGKAFYHVPASLQIGLYQFLNAEVFDEGPELFIGFSLTGF